MQGVTGVRQDLQKAYCAACGAMVSRGFRQGPDGRPAATCPRCGSLERHRFLSLLLGALAPDLRDLDTVVEIAPSRQSTPLLDRLGARRRISLDLGHDHRDVDALASLTALPLRDGSVDLLVCYHVLEHVPDDCSAMREISRVLSPGAWRSSRCRSRVASSPRRTRRRRRTSACAGSARATTCGGTATTSTTDCSRPGCPRRASRRRCWWATRPSSGSG